jgi:tRNA dimethylallyltransferase
MSVLLLGGPTAAGKSDLAVELAVRHDAALVSADAMTVYRGLDVGTAKPDRSTLARHPHACVDVRDLHEEFDVAAFVAAFDAAAAAHPRVIVVGGTPFYLQALVRPLAALPPGDPGVRARLEALEDPHTTLLSIDPSSAGRLHPNDRVRIVRALEVHAITGQTLTELHARGPRRAPIDATIAWLDRGDLRARIDLRLEMMRGGGYVDEARWALGQETGRSARALRSFAYRHIVDHIDGACDLDEALRRTGRDTWRFARKQRTWARGLGWSPVDPAEARARAAQCFAAPGVPPSP